jgi:hypothetical protein
MRLTNSRWGLGTCVPAGILDKGGYLSQHQKRITHLSLVTDGTCPQMSRHLDGLPELTHLTKLEWIGIQHGTEIYFLQQCIQKNWAHLKDLSIGFVLSPHARDVGTDKLGLSLLNAGSCVAESAACSPLSTLSLSKVTLSHDFMQSCSSFRKLRVLTLRGCPNVFRFLRSLSRSRNVLSLRHFEMCCDFVLHEPDDDCDFTSVVRFLVSFRGLEHLYLALSNFPVLGFRIQDAIRHHRTTLETFIYHERRLAPIDIEGRFEDDRDMSPGWVLGLPTIVDTCRVTALALCTSPSAAVRL